MEPKANGQLQTQWGWLIAIYLFLGGLGAGAYAVAALNGLIGGDLADTTAVGLWIGFPALLIGSGCLIADLGAPQKAMLAGIKIGSSWIARGFWIISLFMILSLIHLIMHQFVEASPGAIDTVAVLGILFALGTMGYTGVLLSASKGIPFWRTGVVPMVFVISAIVTGHFLVMLLVAFGSDTGPALQKMALEGVIVVVLEVLVILFFLQSAYRTPDSRESAMRILRRPAFTFGYIVAGLILPFLLMLVVYRADDPSKPLVILGALLGLAGGLILRQSILVTGALPTWNMGGFQFRRIHRPKEPKPRIGMMPPK